MACGAIDNRALRNAPFPELAQYLKEVSIRRDNQSVTTHLLSGLAADSIPLRVVAVWISGFADAVSVVQALRNEQSAGARRQAIKCLRKRFLREGGSMTALWDAFGGTPGLLKLMSELSVHDVQSFCSAMGRTSTWKVAKEMRQRLLTELTMSLCSTHFPEAKYKNPEVRAFTKFYSCIVPACTEDFVRAWHAHDALPRAGGRWLDHAHFRFTRERCLQHLRANNAQGFRLEYFLNVFHELPPAPSTRKYMSESMSWSLEVLEYLGAHQELQMSCASINNDIVVPLLRRLIKRRAPADVRAKVVRSVVNALAPRMKNDNTLDLFTVDGPLRIVLDCWNRATTTNEGLLLDILHLVPETQRAVSLTTIGMLLPRVRDSYRYKLLALMVKHLRPISKTLEKDGDLAELGPWPSSIFAWLPSDQSQALLLRLIRVKEKEVWRGDIFTRILPEHATHVLQELSRLRPSGDLIDWGSLRSENEIFSIPHNVDIAILQTYVSPVSAERERAWQRIVDERKKEAARAREQADRALWARSAILCSIASGSLDCYESTLLWARRFNRDALTIKQIYASDTICTRPGIGLLGALPTAPRAGRPMHGNIEEDVKKGNKIMLTLLETAFQGLREPSFQPYDWGAVLRLFSEVVGFRLRGTDEAQDSLTLTDDHSYAAVWQDTLDTLLLAEEQLLREEHERMNARSAKGIFGRTNCELSGSIRTSTCRFIDELAKSRDELWQKYRRHKDPNVVSLQAPWPKGLAFHSVTPATLGVEVEGYAGRCPYLESRAEAVVFISPALALSPCPTDEAVRKAIGGHVDDYEEALEFYVDAGIDEVDRTQRKKLAWQHATGPLGEGRGMFATESMLFWENKFADSPVIWSRAELKTFTRPDPILPPVDDPEEPTEWNPDPNPQQWTLGARALEPTCIDAISQGTKHESASSGTLLRIPRQTMVSLTRQAFWEDYYTRQVKSVAPAAREGLIALGLMLINSKCCANKRLFAKPFPGTDDSRFPALFLDQEFLERHGISAEHGFVTLERLARDAPLTLVAELCEAMLSNLGQEADGRRNFEQETLRLLKILVESDRPDLARDLVRKVVIDRPDASSWHRHMLTKGLFDRMKSDQARRFLWELALSIKTKLQEQSQRKPVLKGEQAVSTPPLIKVTTVTALAQLLSGAKFVSGEESVDILSNIFANASHPDIRVAIIQSLVSILQRSRHDTVRAKIMDALEAHAVPVASSVSERSPMTEQDWQRAEAELTLPEVSDPHSHTLQPVLHAINDAYGSLSVETMRQLYDRVLLPVLDVSAANNHRWMRIFLRKHHLLCDIDNLPLIPPKLSLLDCLVHRDVQHRREEIFTLWGEAVMTNLNPPYDVAEINSVIANNRDLHTSNAGKHWLSLWNNPGVAALSVAGPQLHNYLPLPELGQVGSVPVPLIQRMVFEQLRVMIMRSDERFSEQDYILHHLARPQQVNEAYEQTWDRNVRPLIQRVVDKIESLRTPQWQRDQNRIPVALRDTFDMRLWLLTWPSYTQPLVEKSEQDRRLSTFAAELTKALHRLTTHTIETGQPYHPHLHHLKETARAINPQDFCFLAVHFGTRWQELRLENYLGIEIAEMLLQGAHRPSSTKTVRQVGEMVKSWTASADESVRMAGLRMGRMFGEARGRDGGVRGWFWEMGGAL